MQMPTENDLKVLGSLVDHALQAATQLDETATVYLLSMASEEVAQRIEAAKRTTTVRGDDE
jgi:hypothetical protein